MISASSLAAAGDEFGLGFGAGGGGRQDQEEEEKEEKVEEEGEQQLVVVLLRLRLRVGREGGQVEEAARQEQGEGRRRRAGRDASRSPRQVGQGHGQRVRLAHL